MLSFIGLGNIGNEYANTKHNAGFWVLDELCKRWKINFLPSDNEYVYAENNNNKVLLIKPTTGMNNSGIIIKSVIKKWNLKLENLFVIFDDVDLPLGSLRKKPKTSRGICLKKF